MKKLKINPLLFPVTLLILSVLMILNLVLPDSSFSHVENRSLAGFPWPNSKNMYDGRYGQDLEHWYSDQFPFRNTFFHLNYIKAKMTGQEEIQDVYLGKGALLAKPDAGSADVIEANANAIKLFAQASDLKTRVMIVPGAAIIQPDKLPAYAPIPDQKAMLDQSKNLLADYWIDVDTPLAENAKENLYYKTDHHMTALGAGLVSKALMGGFDQQLDTGNYNIMQVSNNFKGTLASKTGSIFLKDKIDIAVAKDNPEYLVTYADGTQSPSIYNTKALKQKDQYQLFLGANQAVVTIETNAKTTKSLLILKDSYANEMIQYLLPFYSSIVVVDPRYYYDDLDTLISAWQIDEVACIFSADTWVSQKNLSEVLMTFDAAANLKAESATQEQAQQLQQQQPEADSQQVSDQPEAQEQEPAQDENTDQQTDQDQPEEPEADTES